MAEFHGHVASVVEEVQGSETTADLTAAETVVPIAETADFAEGTDVLIAGEVYTVADVDDDAPSITLETGLVADVDAETRVDVWNVSTGRAVSEWIATLRIPRARQARMTRSAISPRLAMRTESNKEHLGWKVGVPAALFPEERSGGAKNVVV